MARVDCSLTVRTESSHSLSASDEEQPQSQSQPVHAKEALAAVASAAISAVAGTLSSPSSGGGGGGGGKQSPVAMIAVSHRQDNDFGGSSQLPTLADSATSAAAASASVSAAASLSDRLRQVVSPDSCSIASGVTTGSAENDDLAGDGDGGDVTAGDVTGTETATPTMNNTPATPASNAGSTESSLAFYGIRDSRDEEEGDCDCDSNSLGYSDDSASLSDVYFHPQPGDDLSRPGIAAKYPYHRGDVPSFDPLYPSPPPPLLLQQPYQQQLQQLPGSGAGGMMYGYNIQSQTPAAAAPQFPLASYYGSMGAAAAATAQHAYHSQTRIMHMHSPPMAIQEDSPLLLAPCTNDGSTMTTDGTRKTAVNNNTITTTLANHPHYDYDGSEMPMSSNKKSSTVVSKKEQRRRRKQQQRQHAILTLRQREQAARERAVHQVKGQLQLSETWQDAFWAVVFLIQLIVVLAFAVRYGWYFYKFNINGSAAAWRSVGKFHWQGRRGRLFAPDPVNSDDYYNNNNATTTTDINTTTTITTTTYNYDSDDDDFSSDFTIDFKNVVALTFCVGFYGWIISYLSFGFMLIVARSLIQIMLVSSILLALAWGVVGLLLDPYGIISLMGFAALLLTLGYTMYSWNRIPFAATNLYTALCALRCTADITILGLVSLIVAFGWCLLWTVAFVGIVNSNNSTDCDLNLNDCVAQVNQGRWIPIYLLLLLSFHWTNMVIKNIVRVTVASAIGTWWFQPPSQTGRRFCTAAVLRPLGRACTKSLGSICVGALVIQPAQFLKVVCRLWCCSNISTTAAMNQQYDACQQYPTNIPKRFSSSSSSSPLIGLNTSNSNNNSNGSSSTPTASNGSSNSANTNSNTDDAHETSGLVHDHSFRIDSPADSVNLSHRIGSICQPFQHTLRSCNRWAFTYIGMYNYSFLDAGEKAIQLFETRQWMEVVEDSLIHNVLLMASVVIGGSAGVFAVVVEETDGFEFTSFHQPMFSAFLIGSVLGYVLSNILLLGVVGSAVNTVLVCFAAGPFEFDKNHSRLSREMREVWSQQVWEPAPSASSSSSMTITSPAAAAAAATRTSATASIAK